MEADTLGVALAIMKSMPDNAAHSAAEAEAAAKRAETAADSVTAATLEEVKSYLNIP